MVTVIETGRTIARPGARKMMVSTEKEGSWAQRAKSPPIFLLVLTMDWWSRCLGSRCEIGGARSGICMWVSEQSILVDTLWLECSTFRQKHRFTTFLSSWLCVLGILQFQCTQPSLYLIYSSVYPFRASLFLTSPLQLILLLLKDYLQVLPMKCDQSYTYC